MIKNSLIAIGATARELLRDWRSLGIFNALYAALLLTLYFFVATKEASAWQLVLTALLAAAAPILFFVLQSASVIRYAQSEARPVVLLKRSLKVFWKLFLISVPLILLAALCIFLLNKAQAQFPGAEIDTPRRALTPMRFPSPHPVQPLRWSNVVMASVRLLLLGVALPLAGVHLWLAIAREGFISTVKKSWRIVARAFAPQSIFVYGTCLILFGLMPYFLLFTQTPVRNAWFELGLFGVRLALTFVFTLWGWLITIGSLARTTFETLPVEEAKAQL